MRKVHIKFIYIHLSKKKVVGIKRQDVKLKFTDVTVCLSLELLRGNVLVAVTKFNH